jgi:hypothetical protein
MSDESKAEQARRRALRVLRMVHELHKLGYQRLRIVPGMSPSGCFWRCSVTHIGNILKTHGAMCWHFDRDMAYYSSGQMSDYFGWVDAHQATVQQLAARFLERFPEIARRGQGLDWSYAGWYVQMLGFAERGEFAVAYADWYHAPDPRWLPTTARTDSGLPVPPGGEAEPVADEAIAPRDAQDRPELLPARHAGRGRLAPDLHG